MSDYADDTGPIIDDDNVVDIDDDIVDLGINTGSMIDPFKDLGHIQPSDYKEWDGELVYGR